MGSFDRSKKRIQLWKKALFHFFLCFFMGFFLGFAPSGTASIFSNQAAAYNNKPMIRLQATSPDAIPTVDERVDLEAPILNISTPTTGAGATAPMPNAAAESHAASDEQDAPAAADHAITAAAAVEVEPQNLTPRRLLILITTTRVGDPLQGVLLRRLGNTLRLVPPPVLWVVVQSQREAPRTAEMLRKTGVMYRHLVYSKEEDLTDSAAEAHHQRNVALNHVENHRLDGIVHFAGLSNVYDLRFFDVIRETEVFGAWPVASVSANRKRVALEGPVCRSSSRLLGWHVVPAPKVVVDEAAGNNNIIPRIDVSGFAFNSSILWDPERWGRPTSLPDISQDSFKFVQEVVLEDESKLKGLPPPDCSRILMWRLHISRRNLFSDFSASSPPSDQNNTRKR